MGTHPQGLALVPRPLALRRWRPSPSRRECDRQWPRWVRLDQRRRRKRHRQRLGWHGVRVRPHGGPSRTTQGACASVPEAPLLEAGAVPMAGALGLDGRSLCAQAESLPARHLHLGPWPLGPQRPWLALGPGALALPQIAHSRL